MEAELKGWVDAWSTVGASGLLLISIIAFVWRHGGRWVSSQIYLTEAATEFFKESAKTQRLSRRRERKDREKMAGDMRTLMVKFQQANEGVVEITEDLSKLKTHNLAQDSKIVAIEKSLAAMETKP